MEQLSIVLLIYFLLITVILIYPVMLAARFVGAGKTGFSRAAIAVFLQVALSFLLKLFVTNNLIVVLVGITVGAVIYSLILNTTIPRGFAVGFLAAMIGAVAAVLIAVFSAGLITGLVAVTGV